MFHSVVNERKKEDLYLVTYKARKVTILLKEKVFVIIIVSTWWGKKDDYWRIYENYVQIVVDALSPIVTYAANVRVKQKTVALEHRYSNIAGNSG